MSWSCECHDGFSGNGKFCKDIDECVEASHECDVNKSSCLNTFGSFTCDCFEGYEKAKNQTCDDIDECLLLASCPTNSTCENTDGSFTCSCVEGTILQVRKISNHKHR